MSTHSGRLSGTMDLAWAYDNLGRSLTATTGAQTLTMAYDALSRTMSESGPLGMMAYQHDPAGRVTRITWPDGVFAQYDHDPYGAVTLIQENGTSGLAAYGWTDLGQPASVQRFGGSSTAHGYDAWGRMTSMSHDLPGSAGDVALGYGWNAAGQIASRTISNPGYVSAPVTGTTGYANDGLNRVTSVGGVPVGYDANRNLTDAAGTIYGFDAAGRMTYGAGSDYAYDPADRLYSSGSPSGPTTRFQYAGEQLVAEYDATGALLSRHVPGPGLDQTLLSYTGSSLGARSWLFGDERGSVIARADGSGVAINRYDEYGVPAPGNAGRFGYTGQMWLPEAGVYHYRARAYAPQLGRFLQTDPIGYAAGANLSTYVGADPTNYLDRSGLDRICVRRREGLTRSCVIVDGDGDGVTNEDDVGSEDEEIFGRHYRDFIRNNNGRDLSSFGLTLTGNGSARENIYIRIASQFVGARMNDLGGISASRWNRIEGAHVYTAVVRGVYGEYPGSAGYAFDTRSINFTRNWTGEQAEYGFFHPSHLARILMHESLHVYSGVIGWLFHSLLDYNARIGVMDAGLGGGGCVSGGGFRC